VSGAGRGGRAIAGTPTLRASAPPSWRWPATVPRGRCARRTSPALGAGAWRALMDVVRDEARDAALAGEVTVTQRGDVLDPEAEWRGPIRISIEP
jgi:hypothetical protein